MEQLDPIALLSDTRATQPRLIRQALAARRRRPLDEYRGPILLISADAPARGVIEAGDDYSAMANRGEFLRRIITALQDPGVAGIVATPDVVDDLALLGALDRRLVIGSMNPGGLAGSDLQYHGGFTAYTADAIETANLDGGRMHLRIDDLDPSTPERMAAVAEAVNHLAWCERPALVEVQTTPMEAEFLIRSMAVAAGLGNSSAYTWLQVPIIDPLEPILAATTLPTIISGGEPSVENLERWWEALGHSQVRGVIAGPSILYPTNGDVAFSVSRAVHVIHRHHARYSTKAKRSTA